MPKYQSQDGNVIDVANPDMNPQLIAGLKQVPDNTIPVSTLMANNQPIPVTQPQTTPVYPVGGIDATIPTPTLTAPEQGISDVIKQITDLQNYTVGKTAYKSTQETAQGLPALLDTQKSLSKQILALQAEAKNIPDQAQVDATGRGITAGGLAPLTTGALRENSIKANILNAQLAASQLDIASANTAVDKAVAMKFGPIEEELKAKLANLETLKQDPALTLAEKNRLNAQAELIKKQQAEETLKKDNYDAAHKLSNEAMTNLANFKPTAEFPVANAATDAMRKAAEKGNQSEVSRIASSTGLTAKPLTGQSDFEQAFLRDKGRLPTTQELVNFKRDMAIAGRNPNPPATVQEKTAQAVSNFQNAFVPGAKLQDGTEIVGADGYANPKAFKQAIADAPSEGLTRSQFIKEFGNLINPKDINSYGLTPVEVKLVTGAIPE